MHLSGSRDWPQQRLQTKEFSAIHFLFPLRELHIVHFAIKLSFYAPNGPPNQRMRFLGRLCPDGCYAPALRSIPGSVVLTGIIRRSMSDQILRFIIRKSYSVCKFSQN